MIWNKGVYFSLIIVLFPLRKTNIYLLFPEEAKYSLIDLSDFRFNFGTKQRGLSLPNDDRYSYFANKRFEALYS